MEYGIYGDLMIRYPKPDSIYLRGIITLNPKTLNPILSTEGGTISSYSDSWLCIVPLQPEGSLCSYTVILGLYWDYIGIKETKMKTTI